MIALDTNAVSEAMKPAPNATVLVWLNEQVAETLFLSTVTLAELLFGVGALPKGRRKDRLAAAMDDVITMFRGRLLPFDTEAVRHYASLAVMARNAGHGFPMADGYIAAIAASRGFVVASRDTAPYSGAKVRVINPLV